MLKIFKKSTSASGSTRRQNPETVTLINDQRLKHGLRLTRQIFASNIASLLTRRQPYIDEQLLEEIENQLLLADVGIYTTEKIISNFGSHHSERSP